VQPFRVTTLNSDVSSIASIRNILQKIRTFRLMNRTIDLLLVGEQTTRYSQLIARTFRNFDFIYQFR